MTNNDELAQLKQLATFMTERFSMNPVSCKILNEDWKKRFPDDAAVAETLVALLAERDADKKRIAELEARTVSVKWPDDGMDDCYDQWGEEHCRNNFDCGYNFSAVRHEQAIREALAAAGIKLEVGE